MSPNSPSASYYQQLPQRYGAINSVLEYASGDYFPPPSQSGVMYAGNIVSTTPVYVTTIPQTPVYSYSVQVPYLGASVVPPQPAPFIQTEARKIVITQLPHGTSYHDLEQLLLKYVARCMPKSSPDSTHNELHALNIVAHPDKKARDHAFAVLGSELIARYVTENLDGLRFQGQVLKARFAKEGVESSRQYSPAPQAPLTSVPQYYQYQTPLEDESSSSRKGKESAIDYEPLRAPITLPIRENNKPERDSKGKSHKSKKKNASPVVANGSSGEREGKAKKYRSW
jgi:hypothetical protein